MPQPPLGLGIMGCGSVARAYMEPIARLRAQGKVTPVACCDVLPERARDYAQQYGVAHLAKSLEEMLRRDEVRAVLVFVPNHFHAEMASAALAAGRHVLLEKPMATTLADARALAEQARQSRGHLVCAPFVMLSPTLQTVARRLAAGDVGRVFAARARYGWAGPDWGPWFYGREGGPLFDLGVYDLTALTGLFGPARRVTALATLCIPRRRVEGKSVQVQTPDNVQLILDFGGGLLASLLTGYTIQQVRGYALEIYGETGVMQVAGHTWAPQGYELWQNEAGSWQVFPEQEPNWPWTAGLDHLVECALTGQKPAVTPEHALHVTEIMIKALESAREGKALRLTTTFTPALTGAHRPRPAHRLHDPKRRPEHEQG